MLLNEYLSNSSTESIIELHSRIQHIIQQGTSSIIKKDKATMDHSTNFNRNEITR